MLDIIRVAQLASAMTREQKIEWLAQMAEEDPEFIEWLEARVSKS
jgi:hypothetical protein